MTDVPTTAVLCECVQIGGMQCMCGNRLRGGRELFSSRSVLYVYAKYGMGRNQVLQYYDLIYVRTPHLCPSYSGFQKTSSGL